MSEFVGRVDDRERLRSRLADARAGQARTVLVGGEAGVGKSRLLEAFAEEARAAGAHVLTGTCEEYFGDPVPYGPLLEALEEFGREHGEQRAAALGGPAYERLVGFFTLDSDTMGAPQQVFLAVRRMLEHAGADAPVVLIFEDLHWADRSTLDLVRHLGQTGHGERRLLLVGSYRSNELNRGDPLWQLLASPNFLRRTERFELPPFTPAEMREFIGDKNPEVVRRCLEWSDGIAFYAEQLMASGALDDPGDVRLPADMRSVVLARLSGMSAYALKVLRVAAVGGRSVSRRLLRRVGGLAPAVLNEALQECFDRQMLETGQEEDVYRFRHALLREAVYQSTVRDARVDLHVAMAEALAADPQLRAADAAAEQASHWFQAGRWPEALACSIQAGTAAARKLAFPSAEFQFERALRLWSRVTDPEGWAGVPRSRLLAWTADAARWSGHVDRAVEHIRQAVAEAPGDAELAERLGSYLWEAGRRAESAEAYRQARNAQETPVQARVLAGLALAHLQAGRYAEGERTADAALELARAVAAEAEEGRALNISGLARGMRGDPKGERRLRRALDIARALDHIEDLFRAYGNLGLVLEHAGRLREAVEVTGAGLEAARQLDLAHTRQGTLLANNTSAALVLLGRWDEAEKIITEVSLDRPPAESLYPRLTLAEVKVGRGEFTEARGLLASIEGVELGTDPRFLGPLYAVRAELALGENDLPRAAAEVARGVEAVRGGENTLELLRLCALGLRCAPGRADTFALLAREAVRAPLTALGAETEALVRLCTAERRHLHGSATAALWAEVAAAWDALDRPYPAAYARWRQAEAAPDPDRARPPARAAYLAAKELGAEPLRARIAQLGHRIGLDMADRRPAGHPYHLTPVEYETLRLLVQGYDPARIAAERGRAKRTVETQLGKVYAKLGVRSATQAVAKALQEGLFT